jgi:hypothetical protein
MHCMYTRRNQCQTTETINSICCCCEVYSIQYYMIKFVSDLLYAPIPCSTRGIYICRWFFTLMVGLFYDVWHHFQQYFSYIVTVSFIGGGNQNNQRKPPVASYWQTLSHNVASSTSRHERTLIAQVVVNPTTIRSRPRRPQCIYTCISMICHFELYTLIYTSIALWIDQYEILLSTWQHY